MTSAESPETHLGWHSRGYVPHWDHPGMIQSLNFRLADSMPQTVLEKWRQELGIVAIRRARPGSAAVPAASWSAGVPPASSKTNPPQLTGGDAGAPRTEADRQRATELRRRIEDYLDAGHGNCWPRRPEIARLVEDALLHFDQQRYVLLAWCVMPNHVHALIETRAGWPLDGVLHSWKSFTSHEAGKILKRRGEFWQREYLDRYVRNAEHYEKVVAYIEENPVKAGLVKFKTEWPWSSSKFRSGNAPPGCAGVPPASCDG